MSDVYPCHSRPREQWCDRDGPGGFMGHTCHITWPKSMADPFLWNFHTAIVEKTKKPGSVEDQRFLALALCGEAGELANIVKKEWRGDNDPAFREKLADELGDVYAYLRLNALAHGLDLDEILQTVTIPKIKARWG